MPDSTIATTTTAHPPAVRDPQPTIAAGDPLAVLNDWWDQLKAATDRAYALILIGFDREMDRIQADQDALVAAAREADPDPLAEVLAALDSELLAITMATAWAPPAKQAAEQQAEGARP